MKIRSSELGSQSGHIQRVYASKLLTGRIAFFLRAADYIKANKGNNKLGNILGPEGGGKEDKARRGFIRACKRGRSGGDEEKYRKLSHKEVLEKVKIGKIETEMAILRL